MHDVTMTLLSPADGSPVWLAPGEASYRWAVKLKRGKRVVRLTFTGHGFGGQRVAPTVDDVLAYMFKAADDVVICASYEEWCRQLDLPEAPETLAVWKDDRRQMRRLEWLFPYGIPEELQTEWRGYSL